MGYVPPRPPPLPHPRTSDPSWKEVTPWEEWFAWYPVKLTRTKERVWFRKIYRRYDYTRYTYDDNNIAEYGDIFDVLAT